ncbi:MAG: glycosyltransferase family 39 protein, partial [Gammaproteobacteria bacterium]|nr:glycosyltransferase family 39 protein [Gammaproteobacteria bacterium]
ALSPAILFLLFRSTLGGTTALAAALMLAFSEWHILVSREARMYAPFLLFYTCTAFYCWQWIKTNKYKYLLACILLFAISITIHKLTLMAVIFLLIPLVTNTKTAVPPIRALSLSAVFIVLGYMYHKFFVGAGYDIFLTTELATETTSRYEQRYTKILNGIPLTNPVINLLLLIVGALAGYWFATARKAKSIKLNAPLLNTISYYTLAILTGVFAFTGLIYAATLTGIMFFSIKTGLPAIRLKSVKYPLGLLIFIALAWSSLSILQSGLHDGVKNIAGFPFPYFAHLTLISPGLVLLFLCACAYLFANSKKIPDGLRVSIIATIFPIFVIGSVTSWGGARYLIGAYPFLIVAASIGLVILIKSIGNKTGWWGKSGTTVIAVIVASSGILVGNGIPSAIKAATLNYGEPDYWPALVLASHPDHQSAGRFVRDRLQPSDIVVAEDASMQKWYAGRVDFWLRSYQDAKAYLYHADDGHLRDIYVNSRIVTPKVLEELSTMASIDQKIWIITSEETHKKRTYYLGKQQLQWLENIEDTIKPAHIGRDGITKVYCLGCNDNQIK